MAMAVLLVTGSALAQGPKGHMGGDFFGGGHMVEFMSDYLELTDAQRAQVKTILDQEHQNIKPLMEQMRQAHEQMHQLATASTFDEAKVRALAGQQSQVVTELMVRRAKIESQLVQILTPEQKAKMETLHAKHMQRMQEHAGEQPPAE
jgi:protein CpxP